MPEEHSRIDESFSIPLGDLISFVSTLTPKEELAKAVFDAEKEQGKSNAEALQTTKETAAIAEVATKADRKVAQRRKSAVAKVRKAVLEQAPDLAAQTFHMDDDSFLIFMENYAEDHHDSITSEFLAQNLAFEQEMLRIYRQAEREFEALPLSEKAKHYAMAAKEAAGEYANEFAADPLGHTKALAGDLGYFALDIATPGGIDPAM